MAAPKSPEEIEILCAIAQEVQREDGRVLATRVRDTYAIRYGHAPHLTWLCGVLNARGFVTRAGNNKGIKLKRQAAEVAA